MTGKVKVVREEQTIYALTQLFQDLIDGQKVKMTIFEREREREREKTSNDMIHSSYATIFL